MRHSLAALAATALVAGCHHGPLEVSASELPVAAGVASSDLSLALGDSLRVTITVVNPHEQDILVSLGGPPYKTGQIPAAQTLGAGFGTRVVRTDGKLGDGPSAWTWGQPTIRLSADETLRHTFVFGVDTTGSTGAVLPGVGAYTVIASFGRVEASPLHVTVHK